MVSYGKPLGPKFGSKQRANAKNKSGLGRSLVNDKQKVRQANKVVNVDGEERFTTDFEPVNEGDSWTKLRSVTQQGALEEFLSNAELADTDFTSERTTSIKILTGSSNPYLLNDSELTALKEKHKQHAGELTVPRKPSWNSDMTAVELDRQEKDAFLDWRRGLAGLQENQDLLMTPFERNIEVWRQLWRVVDRSDLVVQIVDARNPLMFRSEDLEAYVKEVDERKRTLLLINKADLMSVEQRQMWAGYLEKEGIEFVFFSAKTSLREQEADEDDEDDVPEDLKEGLVEKKESDDSRDSSANGAATSNVAEENDEKIRILSVDDLESLFLSKAPSPPLHSTKTQIGLVGYPNVGKSSTINALIGAKKVSVSSTPGKTKHFQTINLSPDVVLCDCPGLVFPNFASTEAELVCNGVLPIDQLREFTGPIQLVCQRIPKYFIEAVYGISIHTKAAIDGGTGAPSSEELLQAYAKSRGYMRSGQGNPDESRAARYILKDYVDAKLPFVHPPPTFNGNLNEFNKTLYVLDNLPKQRQVQILEAVKDGRETIDLEKDLKDLKFSQHSSESDRVRTSKAHDLNVKSASQKLDDDFFDMGNYSGVVAQPFHKAAAKQGAKNKKHFKGKKGKQGLVKGGSENYGGSFGDLY